MKINKERNIEILAVIFVILLIVAVFYFDSSGKKAGKTSGVIPESTGAPALDSEFIPKSTGISPLKTDEIPEPTNVSPLGR